DEMCVFTGLYYPKADAVEFCSLDGKFATRYLGATWIGNGTKTCLETADCIATAAPVSADRGASLYACVIASCPASAKETSAVARCTITHGYGQCNSTCQTDPAGCAGCTQAACQRELGACATVNCN